MKRLVLTGEYVFGMANLVPNETGIACDMWSEHKGCQRNVQHNSPRVKLSVEGVDVSISIEQHPKILASPSNIPHKVMKKIKEGIDYVARNYDLFLKHYNDTDDSFTDLTLMKELAKRGDFKM